MQVLCKAEGSITWSTREIRYMQGRIRHGPQGALGQKSSHSWLPENLSSLHDRSHLIVRSPARIKNGRNIHLPLRRPREAAAAAWGEETAASPDILVGRPITIIIASHHQSPRTSYHNKPSTHRSCRTLPQLLLPLRVIRGGDVDDFWGRGEAITPAVTEIDEAVGGELRGALIMSFWVDWMEQWLLDY